jgi:DNA-directed RNA polymerase specialized sigma subunit
VLSEDGLDDFARLFDPADDADVAKEYEDREILGALLESLNAFDLLSEAQRTVIHYSYVEPESERWIADKLGYSSKTSVVRIREKALSILRENLKDYRD